ncbi:hypothetical protein PGH47_35775 [Streptomyces sp. HUAS 31]|uniref:hypothetical protein n=1 Tax=Streptomyces TaxID=1883 RepID=UPI00230504CB|nr:hypothetical protein [Streptomyces sp. HUAS 31]WCE00746.1 hypothetical protein PGH47_35775 [Streptomyces sp. HUAS 31]
MAGRHELDDSRSPPSAVRAPMVSRPHRRAARAGRGGAVRLTGGMLEWGSAELSVERAA